MIPEILQMFCGKETYRKELSKPWSGGEFTIATDGRILIRVPRVAEIPEHEKESLTSGVASMVGKHYPIEAAWFDLPAIPPKPPKEPDEICSYCNGRGESHCGHCGEWGDCVECDGAGKFEADEKPQFGEVGARKVMADHLRLMALLPECKIAVNHGDLTDPIAFKFTGGIGLVMPTR